MIRIETFNAVDEDHLCPIYFEIFPGKRWPLNRRWWYEMSSKGIDGIDDHWVNYDGYAATFKGAVNKGMEAAKKLEWETWLRDWRPDHPDLKKIFDEN